MAPRDHHLEPGLIRFTLELIHETYRPKGVEKLCCLSPLVSSKQFSSSCTPKEPFIVDPEVERWYISPWSHHNRLDPLLMSHIKLHRVLFLSSMYITGIWLSLTSAFSRKGMFSYLHSYLQSEYVYARIPLCHRRKLEEAQCVPIFFVRNLLMFITLVSNLCEGCTARPN